MQLSIFLTNVINISCCQITTIKSQGWKKHLGQKCFLHYNEIDGIGQTFPMGIQRKAFLYFCLENSKNQCSLLHHPQSNHALGKFPNVNS